MKASLFLLLAQATGLTFHTEDATRPTTKVVKLLQGMQEQLESEAKADEETYEAWPEAIGCWALGDLWGRPGTAGGLAGALFDKFKCWCHENTVAKEKAVQEAKLATTELQDRVEILLSKSQRLKAEVEKTEDEVAKNQAALDTATALREQQNKEYVDDLERLDSNLQGVNTAQTALSPAEGTAFLQSREGAAKPLRTILAKHSEKMSAQDKDTFEAFLQRGDGVDGVMGVLTGLKDDFSAEITKVKEDEATSIKQFEALAAAKTEEIKAGTKQIETKKEEKANADEERAIKKQEIKDTQGALGTDLSSKSLDQIFSIWASVPERLYCEPYGVPHKRMDGVIFPAWMNTDSLFDLAERWQVNDKDVLLALSPGLCPNIQVLEPIFALAGDPIQLTPGGPVDGACVFKRRMMEMANEEETEMQIRPASNRCLFSLLPPWLVPQSFGKVAVFLADPRYLIMRQKKLWDMFKRCIAEKGKGCGCAPVSLDESDFLRAYLEQDCNLSGEEMQRLARWALEESRQPEKVKIFFVEDFVAEPDMALRGLARFLGVPDDADVLQQAIDKDMLELQHFLTVALDFELRLRELPEELQCIWEERDVGGTAVVGGAQRGVVQTLQLRAARDLPQRRRLRVLPRSEPQGAATKALEEGAHEASSKVFAFKGGWRGHHPYANPFARRLVELRCA
eukprot:s179_g6.t1